MQYKTAISYVLLVVLLGTFVWQLHRVKVLQDRIKLASQDIHSLELRKDQLKHGWWDRVPIDITPMPTLAEIYLPLMDYISFAQLNYDMKINLVRKKKERLEIDHIAPVEYYRLELNIQYHDLADFLQFFDRLLRGFPLEVTSFSWEGGKTKITAVLWGRKS